MHDIAIVGAGPSGAYCALELAKKGIYATIYDASHPREKPCGGRLSTPAVEKFPFLEQFRPQASKSTQLKLISCTGKHTAIIERPREFNISRLLLDQKILQMAVENGAIHVKEKVLGVERMDGCWEIRTERHTAKTSFLVGADGTNSMVRRRTAGAIQTENLGLCYGYYVDGLEDEPSTVKFLSEVPGYIWVFPRRECTAIGIGSECRLGGKIKTLLDNFLHSNYPNTKMIYPYAALLPWATNPEFFASSCAGEDWLLIGDAAGHVDPLSGEGIFYALWGGELAAEALAKGNPRSYDSSWQEQFGKTLQMRCLQRNQFYNPFLVEVSIAKQALSPC